MAAPQGQSPSTPPKAAQMRGAHVLLAHADRCWKAEEANAARIATKANWVLSVLTAVIGLKFFAIGTEIEQIVQAGFWSGFVFWFSATEALGLLMLSLLLVLGVVRVEPETWRLLLSGGARAASQTLELDPLLVRNPWELDEPDTAWYVFRVTYNASLDLRSMNAERAAVIDLSQKLLVFAIVFLFLSILVYTWVAYV